ncbi:MAG: signal peptide peptidase SppA [Planctomycetes bacterium]|nr:signal peptide peptidase SppA [Planctomycetota bacterium]
MKRLMMVLLLIGTLGFSGFAEEEKPVVEKPEPAKTEKKDDDSPIPRLAEMKIDEFVTASRMINLPIPGRTRTVQELLDKMETWSKDEKIGAVLLDLGSIGLTLPDVEELRLGVERMKKAGKKVVAFLNDGSPNAFLLACAADEIATPPTGGVMIPGIGRVFPFMKGNQQMLGLENQVITAGRYKYGGFLSRREPDEFFMEEYGELLDSWIDEYKQMIAVGRNLSKKTVTDLVDMGMFNANQALQNGLVDSLFYLDDYREHILQRYKMKPLKDEGGGLAEVNSIQDFVELINTRLKEAEESRKAVGPKIAVLHARGPIIDTSMGASYSSLMICRDDLVEVIDELRDNKSIKAVVLHIDSPGGSGYASDVIWKHLRKLDEVKPLVVSQGSVAASGGYYLSCPARRIFALPTTVTGSIGVIGVFTSSWSALNRMDYELVAMPRGKRSLLGSSHRTLTDEDMAFIQTYMNDFYDVFIDRVATTRKIPSEKVREIAEGRVYTGRDAQKIGLVDELGGLDEAIQCARKYANIPPSAELKVVHYPRSASLGELFEGLSSMSASVETSLDTFRKSLQPAKPITFEEQLRIFSRRLQPLCWMPVPDFYSAEAISGDVPGLKPFSNGSEREDLLELLNPANR